jgi:Skp family chaperone for outer membrane proteins
VVRLFRSLDAVVADHAREHGLSLVLKKQPLEPGGPQGVEESLQLATAEVLYADSALDISEPIIAALNAQYEAPIEVK